MVTSLRRIAVSVVVVASLLGLSAVAAPPALAGTPPVEDDTFSRTFQVQAYSNQIRGSSWVDGPVTVEVWDAGFDNRLRSESVTPNGAGDFEIDFGPPDQPGTFELTTHQRFVVFDGVTTKVLSATDLEMTGISYPGNYLTGVGATAGDDVVVSVGTEWPTSQPTGPGFFEVTPDGAGNWTADFESHGLTLKPYAFHVAVQHTDANGDNYSAEPLMVYDYPHLEVESCGSAAPGCAGSIAQAQGYEPGVDLHLEVTFPDSSTFVADQTTDASGQAYFDVSPQQFVAGTTLRLTGPTALPFLDGFGNRELVITDQGITNIDLGAGTVDGFAARPGANLMLEPEEQPPGAWVRRHTVAPPDLGVFETQSFAVPGDEPGEDATTTLTPSGSVNVIAFDEPDYDVQTVTRSNVIHSFQFFVSPNTGLFDGQDVWVNGSGFTPNAQVGIVQCLPDSDPPRCNPFVTLPTGSQGEFSGSVQVARYVDGFDAASAPEATNLVAFDFSDPFTKNVSVPLSFARLDLFRAVPDGHGGTAKGDPVTGDVSHGEFLWVEGVGFPPSTPVQLDQCAGYGTPQGEELRCRNNTQVLWPDADGSFHGVMRIGQNVFAPHGVTPSMTVAPHYDLRDGQTVLVGATGLPRGGPSFDSMSSMTGSFIAAFAWGQFDHTAVRSQRLDFAGPAPEVHVLVNQAIVQPNPMSLGGSHIEPIGTPREATWNAADGTLELPYTAIQRWTSAAGHQPYDPPPVENGYYDFADTLTPVGGVATGPIGSEMILLVTEGPDAPSAANVVSIVRRPLHFARFDLGAATTGGVLTSKPKGVTLSGVVTCTGFMPEQYLVSIRGTLEQTTRSGRRTTTTQATFTTSATCSGTMANPGVASWTATLPTTFQSGAATVRLEVSSAGFTRTGDPTVAVNNVTLTTSRPR